MTNAYTEARDEAIRNLWDDYDKALSDDSEEANQYEERFKKAIDDLIRKHVIGEDMNIPDEMEKIGRDFGALNAIMNIGTAQNNLRSEQRKIVGGE